MHPPLRSVLAEHITAERVNSARNARLARQPHATAATHPLAPATSPNDARPPRSLAVGAMNTLTCPGTAPGIGAPLTGATRTAPRATETSRQAKPAFGAHADPQPLVPPHRLDAMTVPTVTELARNLEPVTPDTFIRASAP